MRFSGMEWGRDNLSPSGILTCYGGGGGWVLQVNHILFDPGDYFA